MSCRTLQFYPNINIVFISADIVNGNKANQANDSRNMVEAMKLL